MVIRSHRNRGRPGSGGKKPRKRQIFFFDFYRAKIIYNYIGKLKLLGDKKMRVINATSREENGSTIVNLKFKTTNQLLDPDDPSPLPKKELTQDAEDSILNNVFFVWLKKPVILEIQVPAVPDPGPAPQIIDAIRHHFRFVYTEQERETSIFIRERRIALIFTVLNILIAMLYVVFSYQHEFFMTSVAGTAIGAVIVIINWATIWDSYEYFIFDGRAKMQRQKLINKIINAEIRVSFYAQDS